MRVHLLLFALLPASAAPPQSEGNPFLDHYLAAARRSRDEGDLAGARSALERVLERDDRHLTALRLLGEVANAQADADAAAYAWHRWLGLVDAARPSPVPPAERKAVLDALLPLDPRAEDFRRLSAGYLEDLLALARDYGKRKRTHSALAVFHQILGIDPADESGRKGVKDIRRTGGNELATEDVYAGGDPTFGVNPEWISEQDRLHAEWKEAWKKDSDNYRYRTNAGFVVLQTSSIAMEQMNRFYRQFFRYKLDGDPTPKIEVRIFKNRDEYLKLGVGPPVEWSAGHFTGDSVETFVGGVTGRESIRGMYGTLFHEAAHQFVELTGRGGVPGWLNEAYASFFEGTTILSNGSVKWNQVANHRLFPLAARMEKGWMSGPEDGVKDASGEWGNPEKAPTFRTVVEGRYEWGPPWYAPTWGVVYFLYNYRLEDGRAVFRDALHEYYMSGAAGQGDPVKHFEEIVLRPIDSPTKSIDRLSEIWREWILELRDQQLGKSKKGKSAVEHGDAARERGDLGSAVEFYEEAYTHQREDPEVLWRLAQALEEQKKDDRAAALYREFAQELELRGATEDPRYAEALRKIAKLDPLHARYVRLKEKLEAEGLALARSYLERGLPTMALEVARRMSGSFSLPNALAFYAKVARDTGKSLARWRVAYNEHDLEGWSGASEAYRAYGAMIETFVEEDPSRPSSPDHFLTSELACDVTFDSDFGLEAEMQFEPDRASLMGLCFGRKDADNTLAVVLHPKGFLDVASKHGASWTVLDHRSVRFEGDWQKLRIDVVDGTLDVYLNGLYVRSMEMPSRDSVRGGFGLISGVGIVRYRNVRLLARDPHDPAARIEREIAMERLAKEPTARAKGTFAGTAPPALEVSTWIHGGPVTLEDLRGRPAALVFWTPAQEEQIPTAAYYAQVAKRYESLGVRFVVLVNNEKGEDEVRSALAKTPIPGAAIAIDSGFGTYEAYNVTAEGWGLPRILLLDVDGTVVWEGDPGFSIGVGWKPEAKEETFLDGPLKTLVAKRALAEIADHRFRADRGEEATARGEWRSALETLAPLADLDAGFDPDVRRARDLRGRILALAKSVAEEAASALEGGYPLRAEWLLGKVASEFRDMPEGAAAAKRTETLRRDRRWVAVSKAWRELDRAARVAKSGGEAARIAEHLDRALAESDLAEVREAEARLRAALSERGSGSVADLWPALQPGGEADLRRLVESAPSSSTGGAR